MSRCPSCGKIFAPTERVCPDDGALLTPEERADPLIGKVFGGKYRVLSKLGGGGMGVVYRAEHALLDHPVALKVLRSHLHDDTEYLQRFQREARVACKIKHPSAVTLHDFGIEENLPYLAMEFLEGEPLSELLVREAPLDPRRVFLIVEQIAEVLQEAHELGIVHRDIKPENIFITRKKDGIEWPKVLDFGVAKVLDRGGEQQSVVTQIGTIFGSPRYMAPEQAQGGVIDGRVDLYSVGVLLYEMLSGKPPFDGSSAMETLVKIVSMDPTPLREVAPKGHVSEAQNEIVMRLLRRNRDERYDDAAAFLLDFRARFLPTPVVRPRSATTRILLVALCVTVLALGMVLWGRPSGVSKDVFEREMKALDEAKKRHLEEAIAAQALAEKKKAEAEAALREAEEQKRLATQALEEVSALTTQRDVEEERTERLKEEGDAAALFVRQQQELARTAVMEAERYRLLRQEEESKAAHLKAEAESAAAKALETSRRATEEAEVERARRVEESARAEQLRREAQVAEERAAAVRLELERAQRAREDAERELRQAEERRRAVEEAKKKAQVEPTRVVPAVKRERSAAELQEVERRRQSALESARIAEEKRVQALREAEAAKAAQKKAEEEAEALRNKEAAESAEIERRRVMPRQGKRR